MSFSVTAQRCAVICWLAVASMLMSLVVTSDAHATVDQQSIINTFAGSKQGFAGDGGPALRALLNQPRDSDVAADGTVYVADTYNNRIRKIAPDGTITTIAGTGPRRTTATTSPPPRPACTGPTTSASTEAERSTSPTPATTGCAASTLRPGPSRRLRARAPEARARRNRGEPKLSRRPHRAALLLVPQPLREALLAKNLPRGPCAGCRPRLEHEKGPSLQGLSRWAVTGSNRRPPACKAGALPAELTARGAPSGIRTRATALKGL
jgi:hypothetical protein